MDNHHSFPNHLPGNSVANSSASNIKWLWFKCQIWISSLMTSPTDSNFHSWNSFIVRHDKDIPVDKMQSVNSSGHHRATHFTFGGFQMESLETASQQIQWDKNWTLF